MAEDFYHDTVKQALQTDGWQITHDPYLVELGKLRGFIDLGAETLGAQKDTQKIAVEIKNFIGLSDLNEFKNALGQYLLYQLALSKKEPDRVLFLAVPKSFYQDFFQDAFFREVVELYHLKIVVFDELSSQIDQWNA